MSRRVTLYIGDRRADLSETSPILFTWTREELDNPTVVRNSYTRQVTLPATPANDAIFGAFHRADRAYRPAAGQSTGAAFNPLKKASFALYNERSEVLARGYVKLDSVALHGEQAAGYTCTLYGGLGSLFYDLDTDGEGNKRTLADLIYEGSIDPATAAMSVDRLTLAALWAGTGYNLPAWKDVLTFAPCYNGLPAGEFDANKAVVSANTWYNFPLQTGYNPLGGSAGDGILATFQNKHTEWEVRDFRSYLQRPVVSVKAVLQALTDPQNTGEWTLALEGDFFTAGTNPWYDSAWMTLPLLTRPEDGDWTALHLADALKGSCTPAAFLIGYAKMFGLVFSVDESARRVTLMARDDYYAGAATHDLTKRIERTSVSFKPVNASARWYEMKAEQVDAAFTKEYAETWGRVYGSQRIDTGWEFDSAVKDLLPGFPFKGAADVLETSPYFYVNYYAGYGASYGQAIVDGESVKYKLYDSSGNAQDFDAFVGQYRNKTVYRYNAAEGYDAFPKVQLHGADGKASDGSGVLLLHVGSATLPGSGYMDWHLSDDSQEMLSLNDGRPCWYISGNAGVTSVSAVPHFRRMAGAQTMDFGAPREIAVPDESTGEGASVYYNRWRGYLADRLHVDTKVMTCKVLLDGLRPGAALLRDMYWYRGALWSLNRIKDYAPALDALTECEFVQVRDRNAYAASQAVPAMENYFLNASPASIAFSPSGQTVEVRITANVAWTLSVPTWVSASAASGDGNATVQLTAAANSGAARTGTVSLSGAHGTGASVTVSQATDFVPSIAVSPTSKSIDDKARTFYYNITCNGAWRVKSITASWLTCTSTGTGNGYATIGIAANTGSSSRTGIITFQMTDYPETTCQTVITQAAKAATITYGLELGAASHAFAAAGGSYTLPVYGITYTDGVETGRTALSASDLSFAKSGSSALTRSGLVFGAADLGTTAVDLQSATYTITWAANGAQAVFTATQEANSSTISGEETTTAAAMASIVWNVSGAEDASADGDNAYLYKGLTRTTVRTLTWTSGHQSTETVTETLEGTFSTSGDGLTLNTAGTRLWWAANPTPYERTGAVQLTYGGTLVRDWVIHQEGKQTTPTRLTVTWRDGSQGGTAQTTGRTIYADYVKWTLSGGTTVYSALYPVAGDSVYTTSALTTAFGRITQVSYEP